MVLPYSLILKHSTLALCAIAYLGARPLPFMKFRQLSLLHCLVLADCYVARAFFLQEYCLLPSCRLDHLKGFILSLRPDFNSILLSSLD